MEGLGDRKRENIEVVPQLGGKIGRKRKGGSEKPLGHFFLPKVEGFGGKEWGS
jgi:hypothetical protein